ncbi:ATP-binding protein [Fibrobacter sp.]|uniref:AAA family ATPase n=1 Tax=Fibrobacter sp. TaxID=35828 RepID=UPI0025C35D85|nr:ATP-binding protein [Fibrobacter sp.]MBR3071958.1 ATP-binding protein [Fibrobacter sp.]
MAFIGRNSEISLLEQYTASSNAEFIALYGRRRVGKTYLINQTFKDRLAFSMTGVLEGNKNEQIDAFMDAMDIFGYSCPERPKNWMAAFTQLRKALSTKVKEKVPCIVFIDEIPSLDTQTSGFTKALGHFWNSWASNQDNFKLIVCGSATSWMIKNLIDSKGGLHNRITHEIKLEPFPLKETEEYLESKGFTWSRQLILQAYMFTGGVAYYLSLFNTNESFAQNIDRLYFSENGEMRREYRRLFKTLFNAAEPYMRLVEILAQKKQGLTRKEIIKAMKAEKGGTLSEQLQNLKECGFIRKYMVREKKVIKENGSIYQLVDPFTLFHLYFESKAKRDSRFWENHLNTSVINTWLGLSFEKVCLLHTKQIKEALKIDGISTQQYSWRSKNSDPAVQIDMIIDRADGMINLCEIKYSEADYTLTESEYKKIENRATAFASETGTRKGIFKTLITASPIKKNQYSESIPVKLTADCLFKD